jgi:hypothetical protein
MLSHVMFVNVNYFMLSRVMMYQAEKKRNDLRRAGTFRSILSSVCKLHNAFITNEQSNVIEPFHHSTTHHVHGLNG